MNTNQAATLVSIYSSLIPSTNIHMDSLSHPLIVGIGVLEIMQSDRHCWNWCSRNYAIGSILRSRVYDVDTNYHNLSTKMLDLKDQAFVGEDNCVILTSCRSSRVHDVDTKYHNLSTKVHILSCSFVSGGSFNSLTYQWTLDLEDQTFVGEANCVLSEDNPQARVF
ncbi:uncharacterized protein LOC110878309 isoform X1 [Helianthus annuus]|uniref:uncharacterized protein LOC110878309 isoform X1 n=1 Tax=Helianthus annuus TaxID=4232 RepID=UPI000B8F645C|nr:uncharacterized protein LOC110878309 isoform X1 [Helianthus annuus]